jgi:hypothetical protein
VHAVVIGFLLVQVVVDQRLWTVYERRPAQLVELSQRIREHSRADEVIVVSGSNWSSVIAYQSQRRALMLWGRPALVRQAIQQTKDAKLPATLYVACGRFQTHDALFRSIWGLSPDAAPIDSADGCKLYRL